MTEAEAKKVANVLCQADGYCFVCAGKLAHEMAGAFPAFDWDTLVGEAGDWDAEMMREGAGK